MGPAGVRQGQPGSAGVMEISRDLKEVQFKEKKQVGINKIPNLTDI